MHSNAITSVWLIRGGYNDTSPNPIHRLNFRLWRRKITRGTRRLKALNPVLTIAKRLVL